MAIPLGLLAIAWIAGSLLLDSYVHHHQREVLADLEQRLGRKVEVGRLSASLLTGITAEEVTIGGTSKADDRGPLLTIERIRVRPAIVRTLVTLGHQVQVADIRVVRPTLNVVRFRDGSLNLDQLAAHWRSTAPPAAPAQPMPERTRRLIENARIAHAEIADGRLHFVDHATGARGADVTAVDLSLADLGIRRRPSLHLRAAAMAAQPNLEVRAQLAEAGSLEHLPPPVESAQMKLARTELAPLAPLLARVVPGLEAGVASVDLEARSSGAMKLRGTAQLAQARFAGGAPFDATLDADVDGDPRKGDLDVRRLQLVVGDMSVVAHGQLKSLSSQPRFEDFAIASRNLDFDRMRRLYPALDRELGAELHGLAQLGATASAQQFSAFLDLTAASIAAPGRFEKPRGTVWRIDARGRSQRNAIELDALTLKISQQLLQARGTVRLGERAPLDLYATTEGLSIAALSPLIPALSRQALPPMVVSLNGHLTGRSGVPESMTLDVDHLTIASRKTELAGSVKVHDFQRPEIELHVQSTYLDTADLVPAPARPAPRGATRPPGGGAPSPLARMSGHAVIAVTRGIASGIPFEALKADLAMRQGAVHANRLEVGAWGGRLAGDGSDYDVARGPFHLVGHTEHVDVEQLLAGLGGAQKIVSGRLSAQLDLRGRGTSGAELERSLTGTLDGTLDQAHLLAFDFDELLAGELLRALPFRLPTQRVTNAGNLGTLHGQLRFADGAIILARPLTANTAEGPLELAGRISFDGRLDLTGTLQLQPSAASALFANRIRLSEPLPLSLRLAGDLHRPTLTIPNLADVAKVLVRSAVGAFIPGRQQAKVPSGQDLQNQAVDQLKGLLRH